MRSVAFSRARLHRAGGDEGVPRDDLGADEAALQVGVDLAGGDRGGRAAGDRPGPRLGGTGAGEEGDQVEQAVGGGDDGVGAAGVPELQLGGELGRLLGLHRGQLQLHADGQGERLGALGGGVRGEALRRGRAPRRCWRCRARASPSSRPISVAIGARRLVVGQPGRAPGVELGRDQLEGGELGGGALLASAGALAHALQAALDLLAVGDGQLEVNRLGVGDRVDAVLGVGHLGVGEGAHHVDEGVGLAQLAERRAAEALARRPRRRPAPRCQRAAPGPGTRRGMSWASAIASMRGSGTSAIARAGSRVVNGYGAISASAPVTSANRAVLPALARPTRPRSRAYLPPKPTAEGSRGGRRT